jgi:hypothetical protein
MAALESPWAILARRAAQRRRGSRHVIGDRSQPPMVFKVAICMSVICLSGCGTRVPTTYLADVSGRGVACTGIGTRYWFLEGGNSMDKRGACVQACMKHGFRPTATVIRQTDQGLNRVVEVMTYPIEETDSNSNRSGHIPAICTE